MPRPGGPPRGAATPRAPAAAPPPRVAPRRPPRAGSPPRGPPAPPAARGRRRPAAGALGSSKADVGHAGAASALAGLIKAALCLHQQILPPLRGVAVAALRPELSAGQARAQAPYFVPRGPQFWLRDRADGPRRAAV